MLENPTLRKEDELLDVEGGKRIGTNKLTQSYVCVPLC